jgi:hypothetical protein
MQLSLIIASLSREESSFETTYVPPFWDHLQIILEHTVYMKV